MISLSRRLTKPVHIAMAGAPWRIVFTHGVLLDIEEQTGLNAMRLNLTELSASLLRAVILAALKGAGAPVTPENVGALLKPGRMKTIRAQVLEAWIASMPRPDVSAAAEDPEPREDAELSTMDAWAEARFDLGLTSDEWLEITPRMLQSLSKRRLADMRWRELMNGVLCAHTVNHSFAAPKEPTQPVRYMLHPWPEPTEKRPVYGEDVIAAFAGMNVIRTIQ